MPEKMCKNCPYRRIPGSEFEAKYDEVVAYFDALTESGDLVGPHSCHANKNVCDNIPKNKSQECAGHRKHLIEKYGTVGKLPS